LGGSFGALISVRTTSADTGAQPVRRHPRHGWQGADDDLTKSIDQDLLRATIMSRLVQVRRIEEWRDVCGPASGLISMKAAIRTPEDISKLRMQALDDAQLAMYAAWGSSGEPQCARQNGLRRKCRCDLIRNFVTGPVSSQVLPSRSAYRQAGAPFALAIPRRIRPDQGK
jgi:hypothetical protein